MSRIRTLSSSRFFAALFVFVFLFSLSIQAEPIPAGWRVTGFGRGGVLATNAVAEYDRGTWNVKTGPNRSAIVCKTLEGDISVIMKITDASGQAGGHVGIMTWSSLAMNAGKAGLVLDPQGRRIYFSWDEASERSQFWSSYLEAEGLGFPIWLKLTRSGSYFTAFYSKDGQAWRQIGVSVKTFWAGKRPEIYAGIYGDGVCEQRITDLQITSGTGSANPSLPAEWVTEIHGQPAFVGDSQYKDGRWTLAGGSPTGRGGYHNVTALRSVTNRTQLTAKVRLSDLADPRAAAGLLVNAHDMDAGIMVLPSSGKMTFFTRQSSSGRFLQNRTISIPPALAGQAEAYLRLAIADTKVGAYYGTTTNAMSAVGEPLLVPELTGDLMGGLEFYCDSGSRVVTSAGFDEIQLDSIAYLPGQAAPVSAVARTVTPAPTVTQPSTQPAPRPVAYPSYPQKSRSSNALGGLLCTGTVVLVLAGIFLVKPFNRLVYLRNRVLKAWAQIDVQLKRRHDLIGNFVEAVRGYAKHERGTLEDVAKARSAAVSATTVGEKARAEASLNASMQSIYAVVESYPELKANQNFLSLQGELRQTEDKLAAARNEYNEDVLNYNTQVQSFPTNLIALIFRFKSRDFFELKDAEQREAPKVT